MTDATRPPGYEAPQQPGYWLRRWQQKATRGFPVFVLAASAAVLGGALLSQYWGGLAPCELCLLQRWPWAVAIVISFVATMVGSRPALPCSRPALPWVALLLAVVFAIGTALALYHVGVERHWFAGPSACSGAATAADTLEALKAQILRQQPVRCDEVAWSLWEISLAGWNLLASLVMAGGCLAMFLHSRGPLRRAGMRRGTV
jgi:disulfide bond formation protein DsbB